MSLKTLAPELLDEAGYAVLQDFLSPDRVDAINAELDACFRAPSFNSPFYATIHDWHVRSVTSPTLLRSVNVLELAVDVAEAIAARSPSFDPADYYVMNIAVYTEAKNAKPLEWHTDNNPSLWSGQVYIRGGSERAGQFQYMRGTHRRTFDVEHYLPPDLVAGLADRADALDCRPGSLVIFQPHGFHGRTACLEERRVIRVEFMARKSDYRLLKPFFPSHCLTDRVAEHIRLFSNYEPGKLSRWKQGPLGTDPSQAPRLAQRALGVFAAAEIYARRLLKI